jgi:hypothetical protein
MSAAIYDSVFGALAIKQCAAAEFSPNNQIDPARMSGAVDPTAHYLGQGEPRARWTSHDLATILGAVSVTAGLYVASGTITVPWNRRAAGSTFLGATSHFRLNGTKGLLWPTQFEANQGDPKARCMLECAFLSSNGLAVPVTASTAQSLAAQSFTSEFRLGPVAINGSALPGVVGIVVNTGIQVELEYLDGGVFPTNAYITQRDPSMDIRFRDETALATYGPLVAAVTSAVAYFRKKSAGGTVVADATEEHIALSFADGITDVQQIGGSGTATAEPALRIVGETLTASAASAIS